MFAHELPPGWQEWQRARRGVPALRGRTGEGKDILAGAKLTRPSQPRHAPAGSRFPQTRPGENTHRGHFDARGMERRRAIGPVTGLQQ